MLGLIICTNGLRSFGATDGKGGGGGGDKIVRLWRCFQRGT